MDVADKLFQLQEECAAAPTFGINAKHLILQAAGIAADDVCSAPGPRVSAPRPVVQKRVVPLEPPKLWKASELVQLVPVRKRPLVEFDPRSSIPRLTRQGVTDRLFGEYLVWLLETLKATPETGLKVLMKDEAVWQAAHKAALGQEKDLYYKASSKASYMTTAGSASARPAKYIVAEPLSVLKSKYLPEQEAFEAAEANTLPAEEDETTTTPLPACPNLFASDSDDGMDEDPPLSPAALDLDLPTTTLSSDPVTSNNLLSPNLPPISGDLVGTPTHDLMLYDSILSPLGSILGPNPGSLAADELGSGRGTSNGNGSKAGGTMADDSAGVFLEHGAAKGFVAVTAAKSAFAVEREKKAGAGFGTDRRRDGAPGFGDDKSDDRGEGVNPDGIPGESNIMSVRNELLDGSVSGLLADCIAASPRRVGTELGLPHEAGEQTGTAASEAARLAGMADRSEVVASASAECVAGVEGLVQAAMKGLVGGVPGDGSGARYLNEKGGQEAGGQASPSRSPYRSPSRARSDASTSQGVGCSGDSEQRGVALGDRPKKKSRERAGKEGREAGRQEGRGDCKRDEREAEREKRRQRRRDERERRRADGGSSRAKAEHSEREDRRERRRDGNKVRSRERSSHHHGQSSDKADKRAKVSSRHSPSHRSKRPRHSRHRSRSRPRTHSRPRSHKLPQSPSHSACHACPPSPSHSLSYDPCRSQSPYASPTTRAKEVESQPAASPSGRNHAAGLNTDTHNDVADSSKNLALGKHGLTNSLGGHNANGDVGEDSNAAQETKGAPVPLVNAQLPPGYAPRGAGADDATQPSSSSQLLHPHSSSRSQDCRRKAQLDPHLLHSKSKGLGTHEPHDGGAVNAKSSEREDSIPRPQRAPFYHSDNTPDRSGSPAQRRADYQAGSSQQQARRNHRADSWQGKTESHTSREAPAHHKPGSQSRLKSASKPIRSESRSRSKSRARYGSRSRSRSCGTAPREDERTHRSRQKHGSPGHAGGNLLSCQSSEANSDIGKAEEPNDKEQDCAANPGANGNLERRRDKKRQHKMKRDRTRDSSQEEKRDGRKEARDKRRDGSRGGDGPAKRRSHSGRSRSRGREPEDIDGLEDAAQGSPGSAQPHNSGQPVGEEQEAERHRVREHLKLFVRTTLDPFYKSKDITREEYTTIARKCVDKVTSAHPNEDSADFLLREASQIRRLVKSMVKHVQQKRTGES